MRVLELDRPWLETSFPFQGFIITSETDLERLRAQCTWVEVDTQGPTTATRPQLRVVRGGGGVSVRPSCREGVEREFPRTVAMYQRARVHVERLFSDVRMGRSLDLESTRQLVDEMVDSAIRNPDALLLLGNLHERDAHAAAHSVQVCALALAFGRHLGWEPARLRELGIGALLHDIGKLRIPPELLARRTGLSPAQRRAMQAHTTAGAAILRQSGVPASAVDIALSHHETSNGRGYPHGLSGEAIPEFARLVAIVDTYNTLTAGHESQLRITCTEALKSIYQWRGQLFDAAMVERFIECLGIYPVGSLVELDSGELGIVFAAHPQRRLTPKLLLVRGRNGRPCKPPRIVDLALQASHGRQRHIVHVHDPARFDIDVRAYVLRERPWPSLGAS